MGKRLSTIMILVLVSLPFFSQTFVSSFLDEIDKGAKSSAMQINVSGKMLSLAAKNDKNIDSDTRKLFLNIDKISVVSGLPTNKKLETKLDEHLVHYEELMSVAENNQTIRMYTKESKDKIEEFVLCVISSNDITLMSITGKIDLDQIAKLSRGIKLQGVEHLDKINNAKNNRK